MENLKKLQESIGCETPILTDVLKWHSSNGRDKYPEPNDILRNKFFDKPRNNFKKR